MMVKNYILPQAIKSLYKKHKRKDLTDTKVWLVHSSSRDVDWDQMACFTPAIVFLLHTVSKQPSVCMFCIVWAARIYWGRLKKKQKKIIYFSSSKGDGKRRRREIAINLNVIHQSVNKAIKLGGLYYTFSDRKGVKFSLVIIFSLKNMNPFGRYGKIT